MKCVYISPSIFPSRSANSIHVLMQCAGLVKAGVELKLYGKRSIDDESILRKEIFDTYGFNCSKVDIHTYYSKSSIADSLKIAFHALKDLLGNPWPDFILSRNLYAAFVVSVLMRRPLVFETHQLEYGFRKKIQYLVMSCKKVITIVISQKLVDCLTEYHGKAPFHPLVLHDAAPDGITTIPHKERRSSIEKIVDSAKYSWNAICGYFGHLYRGRGVEIIEQMAQSRPNILFLLFGGNESDIQSKRASNKLKNVVYVGYVSHPVAQNAMRSVDILLMPYQKSVSIGVAKHDTARWMSPMKMFEYLAAGVPIISSDLPVLREVLENDFNCLLADPENCYSWLEALDKLVGNSELAKSIGRQGHSDYKNKYTWYKRGLSIIDEVKKM